MNFLNKPYHNLHLIQSWIQNCKLQWYNHWFNNCSYHHNSSVSNISPSTIQPFKINPVQLNSKINDSTQFSSIPKSTTQLNSKINNSAQFQNQQLSHHNSKINNSAIILFHFKINHNSQTSLVKLHWCQHLQPWCQQLQHKLH